MTLFAINDKLSFIVNLAHELSNILCVMLCVLLCAFIFKYLKKVDLYLWTLKTAQLP